MHVNAWGMIAMCVKLSIFVGVVCDTVHECYCMYTMYVCKCVHGLHGYIHQYITLCDQSVFHA